MLDEEVTAVADFCRVPSPAGILPPPLVVRSLLSMSSSEHGPVLVVAIADLGPPAFQLGLSLYIALSLLLAPWQEIRFQHKQAVRSVLAERYAQSPIGVRGAARLALLYGAGRRRSELAALDIDGYDANSGMLRVQGKCNKERTVPESAPGVIGTGSPIDFCSHLCGLQHGPHAVDLERQRQGRRSVIRTVQGPQTNRVRDPVQAIGS